MMKWKSSHLGAVADLCLGKMLDQNKNRGESLPYLANVNVRWGDFALGNLRMMRFEPHERDRYGLKFGDIVMCEGGEPGRCAIWREQVPGMMIQKALHRIRSHDVLDYRFLFYELLNIGNSKGFDRYFTGATIKHLPGEKLAKVEVAIPPLPTQRRIAGILSAYDELIENSQRRIKILEAMARALYREWFVRFRFPGHEKLRRVPSPLGEIPEGWEVRKLKDVCHLTMGQSPKSEFYNETGEGVAFHQGVTDFGDRFPSDRLFCTSAGRIAEAGDILFSVRAPVGRLNIANKTIVLGRGLSAIRHRQNHQAFLWEQLRNRFTEDDMMGNGAIFASVTKGDMQGIDLVCPPPSFVEAATKQFEPLHSEIATLSQQVQNLRRTRDLLLPRLLSGQIDVSNQIQKVQA
ncbi:MAG: restriction endonuclease subunit S [Spirochaetales bacterium]|nr:restriction endonuclease subunit S [Spirochaetales bacterium]